MKKLAFALCALIAIVSMSSCTADSINDSSNPTNKSADLIIGPGVDGPKLPH